MAILANFTPDEVEWVHIGVFGKMKPGETMEVDDARANHILNKYGARGILVLKYGDDPEEKKRQAKHLYSKFWMRQITEFNQFNERLKSEKKAYVFPSADITQKAKELGIVVIGPWEMRRTESAEVEGLREENKSLQGVVSDLSAKFEALLEAVQKSRSLDELPMLEKPNPGSRGEKEMARLNPTVYPVIPIVKGEPGAESLKTGAGELYEAVTGLGVADVELFVIHNLDNMEKWPIETTAVLRKRWEEANTDPWPLDGPDEGKGKNKKGKGK